MLISHTGGSLANKKAQLTLR